MRQILKSTPPAVLSPDDELQLPMELVGSRSWLGISAILLSLTTVLVWSVWGTVSTRVNGSGFMFTDAGTTMAVTSLTGGRVDKILVKPGDHVKPGQLIGILGHPDLEDQLKTASRALQAAISEREQADKSANAYLTRQHAAIEKQRQSLTALLDTQQKTVAAQDVLLRNFTTLLDRGLVSKVNFETMQEQYYAAESQVAQTRASISQLDADEANYVNQTIVMLQPFDLKIVDATLARDNIKSQIEIGTRVEATSDGYIATVDAELNAILVPGATVATLAFQDTDLGAIIFITPSDGKYILPGMPANVAPSTARPEEFGTLIGQVREVGKIPETKASLMRLLNNDTLVTQVLSSGAPLLVRVSLLKDSHTYSGYSWTSGHGPDIKLTTGTPATANIVVREQPPITLVIPTLARLSGMHT